MYTSVRYVTLDYIKSNTLTDQFIKEVFDRNTVIENSNNTTEEAIYHDELQELVDKAAFITS